MNQITQKELEYRITTGCPNTAGIVVQKNGTRVYEAYFNECSATDAIHIFSVTKSILSALFGIAMDQGYVKSANQNVLDFFPDYPVLPGETGIQSVTIKDLLAMTAPYKYDTEPYDEFFTSENWVHTGLDFLGGHKPAGTFYYSPIIGAHILAGILTHATGVSVLDFASEHLFSPLEIQIPHNVILASREDQMAYYAKDRHPVSWVVDAQGINTGSWGLALTPGDMAKIGQLYLNHGLWDGKQIIPERWIRESIQTHARWNELSYGYLWWIIDETDPIFAAMGDGGNTIYINAKKNLVISIASLFIPDAEDRISFIMEQVEPLFED